MGKILEFAEALWNGDTDTFAHHPISAPFGVERVAAGTWFIKGFANTIVRETDNGLVIIDPAASMDHEYKFKKVRSVTTLPLHTAVFTHGHIDHCFGVTDYRAEAEVNAWPLPRAIAHEDLPKRFDRYRLTAGYNAAINTRQFEGGAAEVSFPAEFYYPDLTYRDRLNFTVGGIQVRLRHALGETDDHTWVFFPDTRVLCPGDLFIWCVPNAGNPQKVQRYCHGWTSALREMQAVDAQIMLPGHGWPIIGADRINQALEDTAVLLESLHEQTIALMNQGASLDRILHTVKVPDSLLEKPYLHAVYDEPEFIIRNIWRLNGGWYDGMPSHLKPAPEKDLAVEIIALAGGIDKLVGRARQLAREKKFRLACQLADWAFLGSGKDLEVGRQTAQIYAARASAETSTMAMGIFMAAARQMQGKAAQQETSGLASVLKFQGQRGKKSPAR